MKVLAANRHLNDFEKKVAEEIASWDMEGYSLAGFRYTADPQRNSLCEIDNIIITARGTVICSEIKNYQGSWEGSIATPWTSNGNLIGRSNNYINPAEQIRRYSFILKNLLRPEWPDAWINNFIIVPQGATLQGLQGVSINRNPGGGDTCVICHITSLRGLVERTRPFIQPTIPAERMVELLISQPIEALLDSSTIITVSPPSLLPPPITLAQQAEQANNSQDDEPILLNTDTEVEVEQNINQPAISNLNQEAELQSETEMAISEDITVQIMKLQSKLEVVEDQVIELQHYRRRQSRFLVMITSLIGGVILILILQSII